MTSTISMTSTRHFTTVPLSALRLLRGLVAACLVAGVLGAVPPGVPGLSAQSPDLGPADGRDLPATDLERVTAGTEAPLFALESYGGEAVELAQFRGRQNVVLVFYRGHW